MAQRRYGLKISLWDIHDLIYRIPDWHLFQVMPDTVNHRNQCAPVGDQGKRGACTAFAGTRMLGYDRNKQGLPAFAYSEMYLYYLTRLKEGTENSDAGASIKDTILTALQHGVCSEELWPYDENNIFVAPPDTCTQSAMLHRAVDKMRVPQNLLHMKSVLFGGGTFNAGISAYESLESNETAKTGDVPLPQKGEQFLGGHAIHLIGYDSTRSVFFFQQSWGTSWGDQGFGTIPFEYLERSDLSGDFWTIQTVR